MSFMSFILFKIIFNFGLNWENYSFSICLFQGSPERQSLQTVILQIKLLYINWCLYYRLQPHLKVLHTFWRSSACKTELQNYLKIWNSSLTEENSIFGGKKLTLKNLTTIHENKSLCSIRTRDLHVSIS